MNLLIKALMASNVFVFRLTRGAIGSRMGGQNVLLLHTTGRKSGKAYTTPTNYFRDLMHQKTAAIQVKNETLKVSARQAAGEEYQRLWQWVTSLNPYYVGYQKQTQRQIPVIVLTPEK
jgi:hypothetical protein